MNIELPNYVKILQGQHFTLNNNECVILKRVKGLEKKPPLYIFDLTRHCYISSLKPITDHCFLFDVREGVKYNLHLADNGSFNVEAI